MCTVVRSTSHPGDDRAGPAMMPILASSGANIFTEARPVIPGGPVSLDEFPRYPLLFGPSPIHPLERLSAHLGGASVWAKREDCNSGIAYGGNKTRKLEYLVADALARDCDTLVSIGGVQSNHTRQVAAVAARGGLQCVLIHDR